MLTYTNLRQDKRKFAVLTGISPRAFQTLLHGFRAAYAEYFPPTLTLAGTRRQRSIGGGRRGALNNPEQKLLFALIYQRICPAQDLLGAAFGVSQTRACRSVRLFVPVLERACRDRVLCLKDSPPRFRSQGLQTPRPSNGHLDVLPGRREGLRVLEEYGVDYRRRKKSS